jgi:hypothetical protein
MNPNSPEMDLIVKWEMKSSIHLPLMKNHSTVIYKNKMIIFGGYNGANNLNDLFIYDIQNNLCSKQKLIGEIPNNRNGHTATLVSNILFLFIR